MGWSCKGAVSFWCSVCVCAWAHGGFLCPDVYVCEVVFMSLECLHTPVRVWVSTTLLLCVCVCASCRARNCSLHLPALLILSWKSLKRT